jgi:hypothetical protein
MKIHHAVIALALLATIASDAWGQSKRPPPDRNQTQRTEQQPSTDERGTAQSPAIVKIVPPDDAEAKAKQEAKDRAAKDRLDTNTIRLGIIGMNLLELAFRLTFCWVPSGPLQRPQMLPKKPPTPRLVWSAPTCW